MLHLTVEERQELVLIIERLAAFAIGGPRGRLNVIEQAGLQRFLPGIDLAGPPRDVAGDLVSRLENYGYLPERRVYHALGALLDYVLSLGDLPQESASFLASLIVRYSLIHDSIYINTLCSKYSIRETSHSLNRDTGEERNSSIKQLQQWKNNLRYLEEQSAFYGPPIPLLLHNQIKEAKRQIALLEEQIANFPDSDRSNA